MGKYTISPVVKALLNNHHDGQVHLLKGHFAEHTLCGKKLHPISTTYTPKLGVTCDECLGVRVKAVCDSDMCPYCFNKGKGDCQMC